MNVRSRSNRAASTRGERSLAVAALVAVAVLVGALVTTVPAHASHVLAAGDRVPLQSVVYNGDVHELLVPGSRVHVQVGQPVDEVDTVLVDLSGVEGGDRAGRSDDPVRAADGTRLVPVSWSARPGTGGSAEIQEVPIEIRLVAGDRSVDLARGTPEALRSPSGETNLPSSLVGVDEGAELSVEVEFDGGIQTLDMATGELDTGVAEALYSPTPAIDPGCGEYTSRCHLSTVDHDARWRVEPGEAAITTGNLAIHAYDVELGWAPQGQRWATTTVHTGSPSGAKNSAGDFRSIDTTGRLVITLDGDKPRRTSGLDEASGIGSRAGAVVFAVDADSTPHELVVEQDLTLDGAQSPRTVPMRITISLDDAE